MPRRRRITNDNPSTVVVERVGGNVRSPFLQEKSTRTAPKTSPSLYTSDLFKRSDEALVRLRESR